MTGKELGRQPAYPCGCGTDYGLSKREDFAKAAMVAIYISEALPFFQATCADHLEGPIFAEKADAAVRMADALLDALAQETT